MIRQYLFVNLWEPGSVMSCSAEYLHRQFSHFLQLLA